MKTQLHLGISAILKRGGRARIVSAFSLALWSITASASPLDFLCNVQTRRANWISESAIGTPMMGFRLNVFKEEDPHYDGANIPLYVKVRTCPFSSDTEYETWISGSARKAGASEWVPLVGAIGPVGGSKTWVVGKKLPAGVDLLAYVAASRPERRVVRLYFSDSIKSGVESGNIGGIQVMTHTAAWTKIPKGSSGALSGSQSTSVTEDLVGPEITLSLKKIGSGDSYPDDFYLAATNGDLASIRLPCDRCAGLEPGETRVVRLTPAMRSVTEQRGAGAITLVNIRTGLRIPLPPVN